MAFQLSPAVLVNEIDLTNIIPAVATSNGATVGQFKWGPVDDVTVLDGEQQLVTRFGKPDDDNYKDWFSAANFLSYARNLRLVRVVSSAAKNATIVASDSNTQVGGGSGILVKNLEAYENIAWSGNPNMFVAKYPGVSGNSLLVAWADATHFNLLDSNSLHVWPYASVFQSAPEVGNYNIVVVDNDGTFTGEAGRVLEVFENVSTDETAKRYDGATNYFVEVLKRSSAYIYVGNPSLITTYNDGVVMEGGSNGVSLTDGERQAGWALMTDTEAVDINLAFVGGASTVSTKWVIDNVAEVRKDLVVFVSPQSDDVVGVFSEDTILDNIIATRTSLGSTSYAFMDSNYKYQYDRYADKYRWVPMNGDMAGLAARTDSERDPWFSFGGLNRGRIKNVTKLAYKQSLTTRDELYKVGINPVTIFRGEGPVLFGDKTLLTRPSAFDRVNVRRLFIVLEKSISTAAKYLMFEFNDEFTRNQFINMTEPFLRDVQGRRGIFDFRVICDESNNTPEIIDRNEFVGDIYIKPARSINFITLNFVAVRTGVSFEEVIGGDNRLQAGVPSSSTAQSIGLSQ